MKQIAAILLIAFSLNSIKVKAQITDLEPKLTHAIGIAGGYTAGYGMSYMATFDRFSFQITASPFIMKEKLFKSAGVSLMYRVIQNEKSSFFLYEGHHWHYTKNKTNSEIRYHIINGAGLGIEFNFGKKISLNIMGGMATYRNETYHTKLITMTGETGLFYKF